MPKEKSSSLVRRIYLPAALALLVTGLYITALRNPFLPQDKVAILGSADVTQPRGLYRLWLHDDTGVRAQALGQYRPITVLSYNLNLLGPFRQAAPLYFRAGNIALLILIGWLTAAWLSRYVHPAAAWLAAFLLVAHPVEAQAINLITARAELLALAGVLGFALLQRRAILRGGWSVAAALLTTLCAAVALGASTTGLLFIPLALAQSWVGDPEKAPAWCSRARAKSNQTQTHPAQTRSFRAVTGLLAAAPLTLYSAGRVIALGWREPTPTPENDLTNNPLLHADWPLRLAAAPALAWYYFRQVFLPDTCFTALPDTLPTWTTPTTWLGLAVVLAAALALAVLVLRRRWVSLALVLSVGQYLLVCHLFFPNTIYAASYLSLPLILAAVLVVAQWVDRLSAKTARRRALAVIPTALVVLVMGVLVVVTNLHCRSIESLCLTELEHHPSNPVVMFNYAQSLCDQARYQDALPWLERVVDQRPASIQARHELADVLLLTGRPEDAVTQYKQILHHHPKDLRTLNQLTLLLMQQNNLPAAQEQLTAALAVDPTNPETLHHRALLDMQRGDLPAALQHYQELLRRYPRQTAARREYEELIKKTRPN